jgi:hypothetical protein
LKVQKWARKVEYVTHSSIKRMKTALFHYHMQAYKNQKQEIQYQKLAGIQERRCSK